MFQPLVDQDHDEAGREVHQEGRHADGQNVAHDLAAQAVDAGPEMEQFALIRKDMELPDERDDLCQYRGDGRAADAPPETVNEQRVERSVDHHRIDRSVHRLARVARSSQHGVQSQIHMRDDVAQEDNRHVVARIAYRRVAGSEEIEDRVEKQQRHQSERKTDYQIQHHHVAQNVLGRFIVALAQTHRHQRRGAHAHQRTERRGEVHQREGERQSRNGHRSDAQPDEDAVDHVVQRRGRHGDNGRYGILCQQLADALGSKH